MKNEWNAARPITAAIDCQQANRNATPAEVQVGRPRGLRSRGTITGTIFYDCTTTVTEMLIRRSRRAAIQQQQQQP